LCWRTWIGRKEKQAELKDMNMLSEQEKREILEEVKASPYPAVACLDALKIVQRHQGWVSDQAVLDIADVLNIPSAQVDSVASYYSRIYRKPVGRHVILVCDSIACMIMGYESVTDRISKTLGIHFGQTTTDNRFTLLPVSCLGDCDHAPSLMIDDDLHSPVNPDDLGSLFEKYD
jgi:NADH-quinone oxidoreductase subunit E